MQTKKIIGIASFITALAYANFASAYDLLVEIPGIPHTNVSMSMYLVGLYDFLLSIVGIVAVMMLIVGGMRYITAAGNQAAAGDAKDIINNAIAGLLLALLSWVIVSTINPDVLYIKAPANIDLTTWNPSCTSSAADAVTCICNDGSSFPNPDPANVSCDDVCASNCEFPVSVSCIESGYDNVPSDDICHCYDGTEIKLGQPTVIAMTVSDDQPVVGDNVIVSGTITTSLGVGLSPTEAAAGSLRLIRVNSGVGSSSDDLSSSVNVLFPGEFSISIAIGCKAIEEWQVVYNGYDTGTTAMGRTASPRIIVGSTLGGGVSCVAADYTDPTIVQIWEEPYNDCNNRCINNCGWRYLRVKLDVDNPDTGSYDSDDKIYSLSVSGVTEIWEFFLTDDGGYGPFNIDPIAVKNYTTGGHTYHCAILETDEDTAGWDEHIITWVKKGVTIKSDGVSFKKDAEDSGVTLPVATRCPNRVIDECKHDAEKDPDDPSNDDGAIWYAGYAGDLESHCGDCSMANRSNEFRPLRSIKCVADPADPLNQGLWRYTD